MLKTKYLNLLVLLPININSTENTRKILVELNMDEDKKMNNASIINIGTQYFQESTKDIYGVLLYISSLNKIIVINALQMVIILSKPKKV